MRKRKLRLALQEKQNDNFFLATSIGELETKLSEAHSVINDLEYHIHINECDQHIVGGRAISRWLRHIGERK